MIGNITKKTMILSPPTPQQSTWSSLLFWWKKRVVAVVKLSHNLQPKRHLHPQFSRAAPEAGALLYIPLPALGQLRIPKETCRVAEIKQNYSIWWMWTLSDFSLFSDQRTDLAMPSLLACAQKTQTALWRSLVPLAPPVRCWCCQATPQTPGLPPLEWVLTSNHASWKGRCTPEGIKGSCELQRSPRFCEIHGLKSLTWKRQFFCGQPHSGLSFQAYPQTWILWTAEEKPV